MARHGIAWAWHGHGEAECRQSVEVVTLAGTRSACTVLAQHLNDAGLGCRPYKLLTCELGQTAAEQP